MKRIPVTMVRESLLDIPQYSLPESFKFKLFSEGDEHDWARIETKVTEFKSEQLALERFSKEFGSYMNDMKGRCLFIENKHGKKIATTTAWYGGLTDDGKVSGRIHWVGVIPAYQGRKLAKPLLSAAMNILASHHAEAYLTTQTTSYRAINMYLNYGFIPLFKDSKCYQSWKLIEQKLNRKIIARR